MENRNQMKMKFKLLLFLVSYSLLFLLLTFCARFFSNNSGFKFHKVFSSFSWDVFLTGALAREVLFFFVAQFLIHFVLAILLFFFTVSLGNIFKLDKKNLFLTGRYLTLFAFLYILLKNAELFPYSFYARYLEKFIQTGFGWGLTVFLQIVFGCWLTLVLFVQAWKAWMGAKSFRVLVFSGVFIGFSGVFFYYQDGKAGADQIYSQKNPNIFLIGVDSLRPDHISSLGYSRRTTPNIDAFLKNSIIFPETITPLGRTFPSWVSILTGQYPKTSGARFNLIGKNRLRFEKTLGDIFRNNGYTTIFAIDEKRFANFDESYGFDFVLGPSMGAADFLLGSLSDLPVSNLVVNTFIGRMLLPFSYGNRAVDVTYRPEIFSSEIERFFDRGFDKPTFFAIHFCLPHYPYRWNGDQDEVVQGEKTGGLFSKLIGSYDKSVHAADRQVGDFLDLLKRKNLLKNSIVILISDHGESFSGTPGDFLFDQEKGTLAQKLPEKLPCKMKFGHGSSLLGHSQNRCLMAFRDFRRSDFSPKTFSERISLVDVAPTLLEYTGLANDQNKFDGVSLISFLSGKEDQNFSERAIFLETGFNPTEGELNVSEMIKKGIQFYRIDPEDGLLSLKMEQLPQLIERKERAVFKGDHYLVLSESFGKKLALALNLKTGQWTSSLPFIKKEEPFQDMLLEMLSFYGDEVGWIENF